MKLKKEAIDTDVQSDKYGKPTRIKPNINKRVLDNGLINGEIPPSSKDEDGFPGGIGTGLTLPGGYINGAPDEDDVKKLSKKLHKEEDFDSIKELVMASITEAELNEFLNDYFNYLNEDMDDVGNDWGVQPGSGTDAIDNPQNYVNYVNKDWQQFDSYNYVSHLPGWNVQGHLSDTYPDSATKRAVPVNNHNEENGKGSRWVHPIKGEEYAKHAQEKWEVSPHLTLDKTYKPDAPYEEFYEGKLYDPIANILKEAILGEEPNKALEKNITYTNSKGKPTKIKARDALRLPKDHPAHIQAAKIVGPDDAPVSQTKKDLKPNTQKPPQPGQPVQQTQTAQGKTNAAPKPGGSLGQNGEQPEQGPQLKPLSGHELKTDAEKSPEERKASLAKEVLDKAMKSLDKKEQDYLNKGEHKANSETRKSMVQNLQNGIKKFGKGLKHFVKHKGEMLRGSADAIKALSNGKKLGSVKNKETGKWEYSDDTKKQQIHHLKHLAIDSALLMGSMALGGIGSAFAGKAFAAHGIGQTIAHGASSMFHHGAGGFAQHLSKDIVKHATLESMGLEGHKAAGIGAIASTITKGLFEGVDNDEQNNTKFLQNLMNSTSEKLKTFELSDEQLAKSIERYKKNSSKDDLKNLTKGLNEEVSSSKQNTVKEFVKWACGRLKLKEEPKVTILNKDYSGATSSLGGYRPDTKEIYVVGEGRMTADICRTLAHELVHRKQDEMGLIGSPEKDGKDGSPVENQAHAVAGILMREYGRKNKQIFQEDINVNVNKGDTVLMGKFKNKETKIKDIGKDDHGMPTINGKKAVTFRVPEKKNYNEVIDGDSIICDKCGWQWKMEDGGTDMYICHKCGFNNKPISEGLLTEGGAAGHLAHPFEDEDLTFGDMKEMIKRGLTGGLDKEAPVSEKLDGQNIAFTVKDGQIKFGRNKGHVKNKGENALDVKGIAQQFAGRGGIEKAFKNSSEDLQAAVKKLSPEQVKKMFGNGSKFMSLEIILPETQNVIPYGKNVLVMHGTIEYNKEGEQIGRSTEDAKIFAQAVQKVGAAKQKTFGIEGPREIVFNDADTKEYAQKTKQYSSELDKAAKQFGLTDKSKLEDYRRAWWNKELDKQGLKFSKSEKQGLIKRFADGDKTFGIKNFDDDKKKQWFKNFETNQLAKSQKQMINPIEMTFLNSGAEVLKRVSNFLSSNNPKAANELKKETLASIKGIKDSNDPDKIAKLQTELQRLNSIGIDKVVPSEGVVFQYNGRPYKFTGAFAPINQINGTFKFDKPKKKETTTDNEPVKKSKNEIAIFSGRFQPFHAGHYSIYKALVDKFGKDNVYVASSNAKDDVKSPFDFRDKKNIMTTMFGIPANKVVQVKNPYAPVEILDKLPKDTKYVTAVSQKDAERLKKGGKYFKNYDKVPADKKKGYGDEGYFIVAPEMQLNVNGKNISGTQLRATFGSSLLNVPEKKKIFQQIYPKFDKDVFAKIVAVTKRAEVAKNKTTAKSTPTDNKKQKPIEKDLINKLPKKLLNKTIKNPDTGRMIKLKSALGYDKSTKVRKNADSMVRQSIKK
jgi:hypothetical protein